MNRRDGDARDDSPVQRGPLELLEREAKGQGVSVAQFVRDAALVRVAPVLARRGELATDGALERLATEAAKRRRTPGPEVRDRAG